MATKRKAPSATQQARREIDRLQVEAVRLRQQPRLLNEPKYAAPEVAPDSIHHVLHKELFARDTQADHEVNEAPGLFYDPEANPRELWWADFVELDIEPDYLEPEVAKHMLNIYELDALERDSVFKAITLDSLRGETEVEVATSELLAAATPCSQYLRLKFDRLHDQMNYALDKWRELMRLKAEIKTYVESDLAPAIRENINQYHYQRTAFPQKKQKQ